MGAQPPVGYGIVRLQWSLSGKTDPIIVTFGCATVGLNVTESAADAWYDAFTATGRPCTSVAMATGYTFLGVEVSQGTEGEMVSGQHLEAVIGASAIAPAPPNCALLIRKNTSRGGRKGRGRCYWPPNLFDEGTVDRAGNLDSSWLGSHDAMFNAALIEVNGGDHPAFLLHEDGTTPNAITSLSLQGTLATQRRRLR